MVQKNCKQKARHEAGLSLKFGEANAISYLGFFPLLLPPPPPPLPPPGAS
jgi:hypothetical protein